MLIVEREAVMNSETADHSTAGQPTPGWIKRLSDRFNRMKPGDKISLYNALIVTIGATLALIAWFPDFWSKAESVSAFSIIRDNPTGILKTRDVATLPNGKHVYDISYMLTLKNTSNSTFLVEFSIDRLFIGENTFEAGGPQAHIIEGPPTIWDEPNDRKESDIINWRLARSSVSEAEDSDSDIEDYLKKGHIVSNDPGQAQEIDDNGGMTGSYEPEHVTGHDAHYIIVADPKDYASVEITYGLSLRLSLWEKVFGTDRASFFEANPNSEVVWLQDATKTKATCQFGVVTQNGKTESACRAGNENANPLDAGTGTARTRSRAN
ncbi:MAG TPA: hypothetical protein VFW19_02795 [Allosphingosinicella sp.]|nr:hypothetical protein [Allosphingosinicella sp.]